MRNGMGMLKIRKLVKKSILLLALLFPTSANATVYKFYVPCAHNKVWVNIAEATLIAGLYCLYRLDEIVAVKAYSFYDSLTTFIVPWLSVSLVPLASLKTIKYISDNSVYGRNFLLRHQSFVYIPYYISNLIAILIVEGMSSHYLLNKKRLVGYLDEYFNTVKDLEKKLTPSYGSHFIGKNAFFVLKKLPNEYNHLVFADNYSVVYSQLFNITSAGGHINYTLGNKSVIGSMLPVFSTTWIAYSKEAIWYRLIKDVAFFNFYPFLSSYILNLLNIYLIQNHDVLQSNSDIELCTNTPDGVPDLVRGITNRYDDDSGTLEFANNCVY